MSESNLLPPSRFHEHFVSTNRLFEHGFERWVFLPGMLFGSLDRWWGAGGGRESPHEGLDICYYRTAEDTICHLGEHVHVPVMFGGRMMRIIDDFLGRSMFVMHESVSRDCDHLYTVYGHTTPNLNIHAGVAVNEGEILGTIAAANGRGHSIASHLHVSVAWVADTLLAEELDWTMMSDRTKASLVDPLSLIRCPYAVVSRL